MRTPVIAPALFALGWYAAAPALAQDTLKYDPILEKRADLRLERIRAQREAAQKQAAEKNEERPKQRIHYVRREADGTETTLVKAQSSPYLVDFQNVSAKRADLRIDAVRRGVDSAFTDWLRRERPWVYRQYLSDIAH